MIQDAVVSDTFGCGMPPSLGVTEAGRPRSRRPQRETDTLVTSIEVTTFWPSRTS
jgi:hypothetical protein